MSALQLFVVANKTSSSLMAVTLLVVGVSVRNAGLGFDSPVDIYSTFCMIVEPIYIVRFFAQIYSNEVFLNNKILRLS